MAGIAGFCRLDDLYGRNAGRWAEALDAMCASLAHRGGRVEARQLFAQAGLAQTSQAAPGLTQAVYKGRAACIAMDGELFHSCGTEDSAEAYVLRLIMREGIDAIERLNGNFAGAVYMEAERRLYLFRDHLGIKPLFFARHEGGLVFGSEMKAILRYPGMQAKVRHDGLCEVLGLGPARRESSGVFDGIYSVLPGHYAVFDETGFHQVKYWGLSSVPCTDGFDEAAGHVAELLQDAVSRQSEGKRVCAFLSGGLDSSLVTALMAAGRTTPVDTFSFDFKDSEKHFRANDFQSERDKPYVERMVRLFGTRHTHLECDSIDLADALGDAMRARDLPGMADIDASLLVFARQAAQTHDVALTGECADEIFNGYPWFHRADLIQTDGFPWSRDLAVRKAFLRDDVLASLDIDGFCRAAFEASRENTPMAYGEGAEMLQERRISYLTMKWVMATLVDRTDRMCAAAGLGARVPFADKRLVEYLWNVPWQVKSRNGVKGLLRSAFAGLLPDELLHRKKNPYPKTYNPAYEKILAERLTGILADPNAPIRDLADPVKVRACIKTPSDYGKPWYGQLMAGPQMLAYWIQMNEWLKAYRVCIEM